MRYITVPKDKAAEKALEHNEATPDQLIEMMIDDAAFNVLWRSGLFGAMNEMLGTILDMYEDEQVCSPAAIARVLDSGLFDREDFATVTQVKDIKQLFREALSTGTGVYFYF